MIANNRLHNLFRKFSKYLPNCSSVKLPYTEVDNNLVGDNLWRRKLQ